MSKMNLYWPVYMNLEKEVLELTYSIHFCDDLYEKVYSVKIAELLLRCAVEIESLSKTLYMVEGGDMKPLDDKGKERYLYYDLDCLKTLDKKWVLSKKEIIIAAPSIFFKKKENLIMTPFKKAHRGKETWQQSYQAVKHNRVGDLHKANIRSLMRAMAALYLLNVYYRNEVFEIGTVTKSSFDPSLGSNIFTVKYKQFTQFPYDGNELELLPDVTYVGLMKNESYRNHLEKATESGEMFKKIALEELTKNPQKSDVLVGSSNILEVLIKLGLDNTPSVRRILDMQASSIIDGRCEAVLNKRQNIALLNEVNP